MERRSVNPWPWSVNMGFQQAELVEGASKVLYCSGQTSVDAEGNVQHAGDMGAQLTLAMDNIEAVLGEAGMTLANVVRVNVYTTDIDAFFASYGGVAERLGAGGVKMASTLLGVSRLAFDGLMVELEVTAVA
jgi:enamine deaminase RidA (YjgF/YER057c/UK114 family)